MERKMWLDCLVSRGQFSNEYAVRGRDFENREFSFFSSDQFIRPDTTPAVDQEVSGKLMVVVLDRRDNLSLVRLPACTFDNGSTITVRSDQLSLEPSPQLA